MIRAGGAATGPAIRRFNTFAIISGILALPIFVGHELVIPAKTILGSLGLPEAVALLLPLGLFLAGMLYVYARLMRLLHRPA